jgi:hypothetical protein
MTTLHRITAVCFVAVGALLTAFGLFSVLGTVTGGVITLAGLYDGDAATGGVGALVLVFYAAWMVTCLVGGPLQIGAGIQLLRGRAPGALHWAATLAGLASCITVYCAVPGLLVFALGIATGVASDDAAA